MEYVDPSWTAWALGNVGVYARYLVDGRSANHRAAVTPSSPDEADGSTSSLNTHLAFVELV